MNVTEMLILNLHWLKCINVVSLVRRFTFTLGTTEFVEHVVEEIEWIVEDDGVWMMVFVDDAQLPLKRALQMLPFSGVPVAAVGVAAVADDRVWPWHALLWSPFYFSYPDSDWRFRV